MWMRDGARVNKVCHTYEWVMSHVWMRHGTHMWMSHITHVNESQDIASNCNSRQYAATHCNTLQHTATHCNTQGSETVMVFSSIQTALSMRASGFVSTFIFCVFFSTVYWLCSWMMYDLNVMIQSSVRGQVGSWVLLYSLYLWVYFIIAGSWVRHILCVREWYVVVDSWVLYILCIYYSEFVSTLPKSHLNISRGREEKTWYLP